MSGLDSLMDGWSMSGSLGKKGSSMNAMRSSSGNTAGARSSPPGGVSAGGPVAGNEDIFGLGGGSSSGSPRVSGAVSGADLDDIFGLGASQPAATPSGGARSRSIPIATPGAPPAGDLFSSPVGSIPSSPAQRRPASGTHSDPFGLGGGSSGGVDSLLGSLGGGGGSMNLRGGAPMVPAKKPGEDDRVGGVGGDDLLGAIFGGASSVPDSGPSSSVAATGGGSRSTSAHASPAGGSSNDLLGDLLGGGGSGVSASGGSPGADSDSSPVVGDARYVPGAHASRSRATSTLAPDSAPAAGLADFVGLEDLVSPAPAPSGSRVAAAAKGAPAGGAMDSLEDLFSASTNAPSGGTAGTKKRSGGMSLGADLDAVFGEMDLSASAPDFAAPTVIDDMFGPMMGGGGGGPGVTGEVARRVTADDIVYEPGSDDEDREGDTDARRKARAARHERNRARIAGKLQEKRDREAAAAAEQAERQVLKDLIGADIDEWLRVNQGNIRTMLANLGDVLWEGHGYKAPGMNDLLSPGAVKKSYHKALVIIHPDKVRQRGGETDKVFIADKVFDQVRDAYKAFEAKEL